MLYGNADIEADGTLLDRNVCYFCNELSTVFAVPIRHSIRRSSDEVKVPDMKSQTLILLIIAGACGLVAMLGVQKYLASKNQQEVKPTVTVLTAMVPIKQGEPLGVTNCQYVTVDAEGCPEGVVTDLEQVKDRSLKYPRAAGDWILLEQLGQPGEIGAVQSIPKGYRVATIPVDATTNHSGMLQPGNRIDLLLSYEDRDKDTGQRISKVLPLLEYVEVFAVDNAQYGVDQTGENEKARNISLLVTTDQMMRLQLAKKKGDISTVLRSSEDTDAIDIAGMDESSLTAGPRSEVDQTSSQEAFGALGFGGDGGGFALPEMEADNSIMENLKAEVGANGGSGPVGDQGPVIPENVWVMAIHEGGGVRVEHVSTDSDIPKDTSGGGVIRGSGGPAPGMPGRGGPDPDLPPMEGLGGLDELASGFLEEFTNQ